MALKVYKGIDTAGKDFKDAVSNYYEKYRTDLGIITKWVDDQTEAYLNKEYDWERIQYLVWECKNTTLISFLTRIGVDLDTIECGWKYVSGNYTLKKFGVETEKEQDNRVYGVDRNIFKVWVSFAKTDYEVKAIEELQKEFERDIENKRTDWAYSKAWDDFNCFYYDCSCDEDCECMGFDVEIIGYANENDEFVDINDVAGFCSHCDEVITKDNLFCYNEDVLKEYLMDCDKIEDGQVGQCPACENEIYPEDITDKETNLVVSI